MTDRLLDAAAIADRLGVPESWVRQATRDGYVPVVRLGRYCRYDEEDVLAWVESLKSGGGPAFRKHHPASARASRADG
jgi:excisionase family DNA binding protein